jgi:bacillithiol biosynthesis deacetylase BshB1
VSVDLLVFGPHPDDIEIGMGGTVAAHTSRGHRVVLCDLTQGELGTNGTPSIRMAEAEAARVALGAVQRVNLALPDGGLLPESDDQVRRVVELIRQHRPRAVALPYWRDRHPDHETASRLVRRAVFSSGLRRYAARGEAWKPGWSCYYFINDAVKPSFVVDVSAFYDQKCRALACHTSQFAPSGGSASATRLTSPLFTQLVESRDAQTGALAGVRFAEGFVVHEPVTRVGLLRDDA